MLLDARKRASTNIPNGPVEPNRQKRQICFTFASRKCSLPFEVPWGALTASFLSGAGGSHGDQKLLHVSLHGTFKDLHGLQCFIVFHEIWTKTAYDFRIFTSASLRSSRFLHGSSRSPCLCVLVFDLHVSLHGLRYMMHVVEIYVYVVILPSRKRSRTLHGPSRSALFVF